MPNETSTPSEPSSTRSAILDRLKREGEQSAADLAEQLSLTAMAVRLQLYDLAEEGLVEARSVAAGRGRPTKRWQLTEAAARLFPDAHQGLAVELINSVQSIFGADGLQKVVDRHADGQRKAYTSMLSSTKTTAERVKKLAKARTDEGYMAEAIREGRDWLLIENHCPVCSAAKACTGLCANELKVFQDVLGPDVTVAREEHILQGARRCTYRVTHI
ncbi:MAG: transcriptional regulator [Aquisalinus sp.]|nr:transcriptional regulator [Aquisalinus sp.]